MSRLVFVLILTLGFALSCSKDRPLQSMPAGKVSEDGECALCDLFNAIQAKGDSLAAIARADSIAHADSLAAIAARAAAAAEDDPERAALVALYYATGGPNWYRNDNWLSDQPITEWYGVEGESIYIRGRSFEGLSPYGLYLSRNNLSGSIPAEIGGLKNLRWLELHNNNLSGSIPAEIGLLDELIALWVGNNNLSGSIPAELGRLSNLRVANLAGNSFTGCLPPTWATVNPGYGFPPFSLPLCGASPFNIRLIFVEARWERKLSEADREIFIRAAHRWERVITADVPDIDFRDFPIEQFSENLGAPIAWDTVVDDLLIFVRLRSLSHLGLGDIAGSATVEYVRSNSVLPSISTLAIDRDYFYQADPRYVSSLVLHEMGHCLGFYAGVWLLADVLADPEMISNPNADPHFTGTGARFQFSQLGGHVYRYPSKGVPVGDGTHWRRTVFGDELMISGWMSPFRSPLSAITIASLADLGYQVNIDAADPYRVPSKAGKPTTQTADLCHVENRPIKITDEKGRLVDTIQP